MNKEHFMIELKLSLRDLSENDRQDVMSDYVEHFENGLAQGKSEEQIAKELGNPKQIAKEILAMYGVEPKAKGPEFSQGDWVAFEANPIYQENHYLPKENHDGLFKRLLKGTGLLFFNLIFVLAPVLTVLGILFAGWLVAITFSLLPLAGIYMLITAFSTIALFQFALTIVFCGVGLLLIALSYPLTLLFAKLMKRYVLWNIYVVFGGTNHEN